MIPLDLYSLSDPGDLFAQLARSRQLDLPGLSYLLALPDLLLRSHLSSLLDQLTQWALENPWLLLLRLVRSDPLDLLIQLVPLAPARSSSHPLGLPDPLVLVDLEIP